MNLYELLGVTKDALKSEIRKAYKRKAQSLHPDRNKDKDADAVFVAVKEAYETLMDDNERAFYDQHGTKREKTPEVSEMASQVLAGVLSATLVGVDVKHTDIAKIVAEFLEAKLKEFSPGSFKKGAILWREVYRRASKGFLQEYAFSQRLAVTKAYLSMRQSRLVTRLCLKEARNWTYKVDTVQENPYSPWLNSMSQNPYSQHYRGNSSKGAWGNF